MINDRHMGIVFLTFVDDYIPGQVAWLLPMDARRYVERGVAKRAGVERAVTTPHERAIGEGQR